MNLCVIPARGGSKRIPRKNIRNFRGKPMIAWSIEAAQKSSCFDKVIVSTDDVEIAELSSFWGAEVPFFRPNELADDFSGTIPVINHAVEQMSNSDLFFDSVCCLYATAPFVDPKSINDGLQLLQTVPPSSVVFSAVEYFSPIQRALRINSQTALASMVSPEFFNSRSQDLEMSFHDAGQFYWASPKTWLTSTNLFEGSMPLLLPKWSVQDIDDQEDWRRAELMHQALFPYF